MGENAAMAVKEVDLIWEQNTNPVRKVHAEKEEAVNVLLLAPARRMGRGFS